jgi:hypothetical protein
MKTVKQKSRKLTTSLSGMVFLFLGLTLSAQSSYKNSRILTINYEKLSGSLLQFKTSVDENIIMVPEGVSPDQLKTTVP